MADPLRALALVCSLKPSPAESSSELLARQVLEAMPDVDSTVVRVVDHDVRPGVELDMGDGDAWPQIRSQIVAADILVVATPTWLGQHSSVCQRVLERLDAELSETDDSGRMLTLGKVAVAAVVGNEDGAHHISGILFQSLTDTGFTVPAQGVTYWNDDLSQARDYKDLDSTPEATDGMTRTAAANAVHLARLLKAARYPATG
ncbi:flavodoxin family protein [Luteipulveratus flavus]|uniref:NAD(P)H-dependent oxidoreductase n=1 Tax=Luteipulveratus flavus TaxID=3031728 RepID=A0ABT6C4W2_9MICO|nr:NAD(P)H-dependent oxidoreductase [Luteipulveratus sp. YIM 133296]MDF8263915.1 NAD(P)H-dependent oxidoreductase [Luteipulveratus sp. YIM 133296]